MRFGLTQSNFTPGEMLFFVVFLLWATLWKGYALWRSSKLNQKYWFIGILVLNTAGIVEIIYLLFFQKGKEKLEVLREITKKIKRVTSKK